MASSTYSPLECIPPEVWGEVVDNLSRSGWSNRNRAIVAFADTCRAFYEQAIPVLYRDITLDIPTGIPAESPRTILFGQILEERPQLYGLVRSMRVRGNPDTLDAPPESTAEHVLPPMLEKFITLQTLYLEDFNLTPRLHSAIVSLPVLRSLSLNGCHLGPQTADYAHTPSSLHEIDITLPADASASDAFLRSFQNLRRVSLMASPTPMTHIVRTIITLNLAATLDSINIFLGTDAVATSFMELLHSAPHVEAINLYSSSVDHVSVPRDVLPRLHKYAGPFHLAGAFISARALHTVAFQATLSRSNDLELYMHVLSESSTPITTLSVRLRVSWNERHTELLGRYAPFLRGLNIEGTRILDIGSWVNTLLPKLTRVEKLRCKAVENQGHSSTTDTRRLVMEWGKKCSTLREVSFVKTRWTRDKFGEWRD